MTVGELIEYLKEYDSDMDVSVEYQVLEGTYEVDCRSYIAGVYKDIGDDEEEVVIYAANV